MRKVRCFTVDVDLVSEAPIVPTSPSGTAGAILNMIRNGQAATRGELAKVTGLSRSTIAQRVDTLMVNRLLVRGGDNASTGGRPPTKLAFNADAGVILAADIGATHSRVAITDLAGRALVDQVSDLAVAEGPEYVLSWLEHTFDQLLDKSGRQPDQVRGVGVGLPGPVEHLTGRPVSPPIMPGWNLFPVGDRLSERFNAPALIDNDVNIMALGEQWTNWRGEEVLLYIKIGTGIGSGIVVGGKVHRGADGAAGDIGHVNVPGNDETACRCGNVGCLEAVAGGAALARQLSECGLEAHNSRDVVNHVLQGEPDAVRIVRQAGHAIGSVLAMSVNILNPGVIIVGGDIAVAGEPLLAGIREVVYRRSLPLATARLRLTTTELDDDAGITGAAVMVIERVLSASAIDAALA